MTVLNGNLIIADTNILYIFRLKTGKLKDIIELDSYVRQMITLENTLVVLLGDKIQIIKNGILDFEYPIQEQVYSIKVLKNKDIIFSDNGISKIYRNGHIKILPQELNTHVFDFIELEDLIVGASNKGLYLWNKETLRIQKIISLNDFFTLLMKLSKNNFVTVSTDQFITQWNRDKIIESTKLKINFRGMVSLLNDNIIIYSKRSVYNPLKVIFSSYDKIIKVLALSEGQLLIATKNMIKICA